MTAKASKPDPQHPSVREQKVSSITGHSGRKCPQCDYRAWEGGSAEQQIGVINEHELTVHGEVTKFGAEQANYVSEAREDLDGRKCHVCGAAFIRGQENCLSCGTPFDKSQSGAAQVARWPTYAGCPHCSWVHDTEGWANGESVFCEGCHKEFNAASALESGQPIVAPVAVPSGDKTPWRKQPDKEGWWWFQRAGEDSRFIVKVTGEIGGGLKAWGDPISLDDIHCVGEWQPVAPPIEVEPSPMPDSGARLRAAIEMRIESLRFPANIGMRNPDFWKGWNEALTACKNTIAIQPEWEALSAEPPQGKTIGGSDVCETCDTHCAELERLTAKLEATETRVRELEAGQKTARAVLKEVIHFPAASEKFEGRKCDCEECEKLRIRKHLAEQIMALLPAPPQNGGK